MTSKYRLIYFNVTGLAEPIRYLFAYGKIPYEDCRLEYTDWLKYKSCTPFGQVPVLETDGKSYDQTSAICRHFAGRLNLTGKTDWDAFQTDIIVDTITDFRLNYATYFKIECAAERENKLREIKEIHNPYYLGKFDKIVKENGGYFVDHQMTWADIFFSALSDLWIKVCDEPILDPYSHLSNLKKSIDNEPNIKAYRDNRPETLY